MVRDNIISLNLFNFYLSNIEPSNCWRAFVLSDQGLSGADLLMGEHIGDVMGDLDIITLLLP